MNQILEVSTVRLDEMKTGLSQEIKAGKDEIIAHQEATEAGKEGMKAKLSQEIGAARQKEINTFWTKLIWMKLKQEID